MRQAYTLSYRAKRIVFVIKKYSNPVLETVKFAAFLADILGRTVTGELPIGDKLRSARLSNRLTLAQVGKALGVGHGSVAKWERDENNPTLDHLIKLADLFDTPIHLLIAENLSVIAALLPQIEALPEHKQQELAELIKDFINKAAGPSAPNRFS